MLMWLFFLISLGLLNHPMFGLLFSSSSHPSPLFCIFIHNCAALLMNCTGCSLAINAIIFATASLKLTAGTLCLTVACSCVFKGFWITWFVDSACICWDHSVTLVNLLPVLPTPAINRV